MPGFGFGKIKKTARLLLPPIITDGIGLIWRRVNHKNVVLKHAPNGWRTTQSNKKITGWNREQVVYAKRAKWDEFSQHLQGTGALVFSPESTDVEDNQKLSIHNVYMTYAYVLALAAHHKTRVSVLDYGGGLAHFYQIGQTLLPAVTLEFHCRELPLMAEAGKALNPEVCWHTDDSFLERSYDLVMINASLQYIYNWEETLRLVAATVREAGYLFLARLPVVRGPSFAAVQRIYGTEMLHWQLNGDDVLKVLEGAGLYLLREMFIGDRPYIYGAPEQCELKGWLFRRKNL